MILTALLANRDTGSRLRLVRAGLMFTDAA